MSIAHALIISGNLLLATTLYVVTASSKQGDALRLALVAAFALAALVDLSAGGVSGSVLWAVLAVDVVLVCLVALFARNERRERDRVAAARDAELEARRQAELELRQERDARELALRDRCGPAF